MERYEPAYTPGGILREIMRQQGHVVETGGFDNTLAELNQHGQFSQLPTVPLREGESGTEG
jgi:hypothetical protein